MAHHMPEWQVDCVDLSADALALAGENVERLHVGDRVRLLQGDLFAPVLEGGQRDAFLLTQVLGSWDVFQTRTTVLRTFGRHFDVLDYRSAVQDVLILRRR